MITLTFLFIQLTKGLLYCGKKLNYKTSHYKQLLSGCIEDNATIDELAEGNLRQLDQLL